ncbi:glycosyltransferase family 4 protein [Paenibacillus thermoaerophilus]|uniref:Glycosyltransferase family 4 protein n=1 Tax=Paenibacillus thermoaerophilus TaxID=1215385 RepID=A0ABW2V3K1_9BACL|nr:glycosyltransferase [Paenibacillus thermoaerophilus]TMV17490.1 glycosyltransferase [Paenibacillus thermoaerophilus]
MSDRKKILLVSPTAGYSGVDVCFEQLVLGIDKNIFEPIVVIPQNSYIHKNLVNNNIKVIEYPLIWWFPPSFNISYIHEIIRGLKERTEFLEQLIIREKVSLVLSNTSVFLDAAAAAYNTNVPHIFHVHASFVDNIYTQMPKNIKNLVYKWLGNLSSYIVTPSIALKKFLCEFIESEKIQVIYNGVDSSKFVRPTSLKQTEQKLITCIGHFNDNKNQLMIIKSLEKIKGRLANTKVKLIGPFETQYIRKVKEQIQQSKLTDIVEVEGFRDDIPEILQKSYLYINSSKTETFPVSVIEAQATGVPVIATNTEGAREIVRDYESGFIVHNEDEMAEKICFLLENEDLRNEMSIRAHQNFKDNFELSKYHEKFNSLFLKVISTNTKIKKSSGATGLKDIIELITHPLFVRERKKRILVITPNYEIVSYTLLIRIPFNKLVSDGLIDYQVVVPLEAKDINLKEFDIIINLRCFDEITIEILKKSKTYQIPFIFITDDNYFELSFSNHNNIVSAVHKATSNDALEHVVSNSSAVVVFSDELVEKMKTYNSVVYKFPTYQILKRDKYKQSKKKNAIVIGYMGSLLKNIDFTYLEGAIIRILNEYKHRVTFEFIGFIPEALKFRPGVKHFNFINDYKKFQDFFESRDWDIALAPLADTAFNRSKTNNKFREYSSLGIPGIYSNIVTYNGDVTNEVNGILVNNNEEEWYQAIKRMIDNPELRNYIGANARKYVEEHLSIDNYLSSMMQLLDKYPKFQGDTVKYIQRQAEIIEEQAKLIQFYQSYSRSHEMISATQDVNNIINSQIEVQIDDNSSMLLGSKRRKKTYRIKDVSENFLSGIKLCIGTHQQQLNGIITITIAFKENKKSPLRTVRLNASLIRDTQWHVVTFEPIENTKGRVLIVSVEFNIQNKKMPIIYETKNKQLYGYLIFSNQFK